MWSVLAAGCAQLPSDLDELRRSAEEGVDRLQEVTDGRPGSDQAGDTEGFCLVLTRTVTAIESGARTTAREAAEELLARAPEAIEDDATRLVEELRARDTGEVADDDVRDAAERLRDAADEVCG